MRTIKTLNRCGFAAAVLSLALVGGPALADVMYVGDSDNDPTNGILMSDLLAGGSIIVDGTEFKNWTNFSSTDFNTGAGVANPALIQVRGVGMGTSKVGVSYQTGQFSVIGDQNQDTRWNYDVVASGPVATMDLRMTGIGRDDPAEILVGEDAIGFAANTFVFDTPDGSQTFSWEMFNTPQTSFTISKDIALNSSGDGGAFFSELRQTFEVIPEPATFALLGLGSLAMVRRRRSA